MTNSLLIHRPDSQCRIVIAFIAAIMIHLCAVALSSRREFVPIALPVSMPDIIGIEPLEEPATSMPEIESPPPPHFDMEFVEKNLPPMHSSAPPAKTILHLPSSRPVPATAGRALALHAPRPDYPYEARRRNITGSGVVALTVDSGTGLVVDAVMEESAGSPILDQSALCAFRRWRFKIGTPPRVRIPVTFTITGAQL